MGNSHGGRGRRRGRRRTEGDAEDGAAGGPTAEELEEELRGGGGGGGGGGDVNGDCRRRDGDGGGLSPEQIKNIRVSLKITYFCQVCKKTKLKKKAIKVTLIFFGRGERVLDFLKCT